MRGGGLPLPITARRAALDEKTRDYMKKMLPNRFSHSKISLNGGGKNA